MIDQLISMAAWKGMGDRKFPLWTLINAYNQQPQRFLEMQRSGFFPSEQGPILMANQLPAQGTQPITVVDENGVEHTGTLHQPTTQSHDAKLAAEVKSIKDDVKQLLKFNTQQHRRIQELENHVKQIPAAHVPTP